MNNNKFNNKIIEYVCSEMDYHDKEKAATVLLEKTSRPEWNFKKMYQELEEVIGKPFYPSTFQKLKPVMFELLVTKFENE